MDHLISICSFAYGFAYSCYFQIDLSLHLPFYLFNHFNSLETHKINLIWSRLIFQTLDLRLGVFFTIKLFFIGFNYNLTVSCEAFSQENTYSLHMNIRKSALILNLLTDVTGVDFGGKKEFRYVSVSQTSCDALCQWSQSSVPSQVLVPPSPAVKSAQSANQSLCASPDEEALSRIKQLQTDRHVGLQGRKLLLEKFPSAGQRSTKSRRLKQECVPLPGSVAWRTSASILLSWSTWAKIFYSYLLLMKTITRGRRKVHRLWSRGYRTDRKASL